MKIQIWESILDRIGDWNPQLFRELKGRLKLRNVALVVVIGLLTHVLILLAFQSRLPNVEQALKYLATSSTYTNEYCTGPTGYNYGWADCLVNTTTQTVAINWQRWWQDIFKLYNWMLPYVLLLPGTYLLVSDFGQEERKGTLNFIRLSPQSAQAIFTGKLLGVPILGYLATAIVVPLHLWTAVNASAPLQLLASYYVLLALAGYFIYRVALLFASLAKGGTLGNSNLQSGPTFALLGVLISLFFIPVFMTWNIYTVWSEYERFFDFSRYNSSSFNWQWFNFSLSRNMWSAFGFTGINLFFGAFCCSQALNRRFYNPNLTIISKKQSYFLVAYTEILMLGFVQGLSSDSYSYLRYSLLTFHYSANVIMFLALIGALSPQRQALIDWVRYSASKRQEAANLGTRRSWLPHSSVIQDLLFAEKSPATVVIAINLVLATSLTIIFSLSSWRPSLLITAIFAASMILICALVTQTLFFMKVKQPEFWAIGAMALILGLPIVIFGILGMSPASSPILLLFSISPFLSANYLSILNVVIGSIGHIAILSTLTWNLKRQLHRAGESELKILLDKQSVINIEAKY